MGQSNRHQRGKKLKNDKNLRFRIQNMLYFIGLGLGDAKDITVKGLEIVKCAKKVFLEHYTSILSCGKTDLEEFYGRNDLILADRDLVEYGADKILEDAKTNLERGFHTLCLLDIKVAERSIENMMK